MSFPYLSQSSSLQTLTLTLSYFLNSSTLTPFDMIFMKFLIPSGTELEQGLSTQTYPDFQQIVTLFYHALKQLLKFDSLEHKLRGKTDSSPVSLMIFWVTSQIIDPGSTNKVLGEHLFQVPNYTQCKFFPSFLQF